jgi:hypothetical protein
MYTGFMICFLLAIFIFFVSPRPTHAQIPLIYQLMQAYQPSSSITNYLPAISLTQVTPTPSIPAVPVPTPQGNVLGTTTINDNPVPLNVGGDEKITTIAVLGDSMIDTLQEGIPQLIAALKKYYPAEKCNILNFGVGASNIEYGLFRLKNDYEYLGTKHPSLLSQKPDIIVVESFAYNNFGNSQSGIDRQWLNLGAITTTIKENLPDTKILLAATIAPNSVIFANDVPGLHFTALEKVEKTTTIKLYLQNLINFAGSQNFPLANAYHPSLDGQEGNRTYINANDNIHPSGPGGELFCGLVAKAISDHNMVK